MNTLETLLAALHHDPADRTGWLALADCLEEMNQESRAELARLQAQLQTTLRHPQRSVWQTRLQELLTRGVKPCIPTLQLPLNNTLVLEASLIPPGTFRMGAPRGEPSADRDERPRRKVTISKPFYLSIFPITQEQWHAVMKRRPARFRGNRRPVDQVNWDDCQDFCRRLSDSSKRTVRLPTEAEWEYACRAGTTTLFHSGNDVAIMQHTGRCGDEETREVGMGLPNGWGLYDMHGNVWEWTLDAYADYFPGDASDPCNRAESRQRSARGGSYSNPALVCRSASRIGFMGGGRNDFIGMRAVIEWQGPA